MYKVTKIDSQYIVIENQTKHHIKQFDKSYEAHRFCKKLNEGNGFQGWTPDFFLKNISIINT